MFQDNERDESRAYSFSGEGSDSGDPPADPTNAPSEGDPPADPTSAPSGGDPPADPTSASRNIGDPPADPT